MLLFCEEVSYSHVVATASLTQRNNKLNFRFWTSARIAGIRDSSFFILLFKLKAFAMATKVEGQGFLDSVVYMIKGGKGKRTQEMYERPSHNVGTA